MSATLHRLAARNGGTRFLGYRETAKRNLAAAVADELAARLLRDTSCVGDGDYGGLGQPIGLSLTRGGATVQLVEDCGHLFLTPEGHDGDFALFAPDMATFVEKLAE